MTTSIETTRRDQGKQSLEGTVTWSAADHALAAFIDMLRRRNLPIGARLPNLPDIAVSVGVSHVVAREALNVLENENIIVVKQGRNGGLFVAGYAGYPKCLLRLYPHSTPDDMPALIQARRILEREISRLAGARMTSAAIETLRALVDAMADATDDAELFIELTVRFHVQVALIAENPLLLGYMRDVLNRMAVAGITSRIVSLTAEELDVASRLYERLLASLVEGDSERIVAAVDEHIEILLRTIGTLDPERREA